MNWDPVLDKRRKLKKHPHESLSASRLRAQGWDQWPRVLATKAPAALPPFPPQWVAPSDCEIK